MDKLCKRRLTGAISKALGLDTPKGVLMNITQVQELLGVGQRKASAIVHKYGRRFGKSYMIDVESLRDVISEGYR